MVLPGVGAFDKAMSLLERVGHARGPAASGSRSDGMPILGICVGMQILAECSEEGSLAGLGLIEGRCALIASLAERAGPGPCRTWAGTRCSSARANDWRSACRTQPEFYFLHSYYFDCSRPQDVIAQVELRRRPFHARCDAETSTACSSTPRRAITTGWRS